MRICLPDARGDDKNTSAYFMLFQDGQYRRQVIGIPVVKSDAYTPSERLAVLELAYQL